MKTLIAILVPFVALVSHAADIRLVGTVRVDLAPIHEWEENHEGKRPMEHWREITVEVFTPGAPWPTCEITSAGMRKTVYLKNAPLSALNYYSTMNSLKARQKELSDWISEQRVRLRNADTVHADYDSEYYQNRENAQATFDNKRDELDRLTLRIAELKRQETQATSDFAMFTGQIYNKMEVWDCGQKQ